jgi:DNA-binding MarR family transcriptional regulator
MTRLRRAILERVSMDLMSIPPLVFRAVRKRITRTTLVEMDINITPHHFEIIRLLEEEGTLHPSDIGDRLQIAKAQMTKLIDRLVALNIVRCDIDQTDRRAHDIALTATARAMLRRHKKKTISAVREIMSSLSDEELENLSSCLRRLRDVLLTNAGDDPSS